jgi:TatD DNase family protein
MILIDTHCHLYAQEFEADINTVIENAEAVGVQKFYLPSIDSTAIEAMLQLEEKYPNKCIAMMGLHPCYVKENYTQELKIVEEWLAKRKFVAIGEIGLDYYWDKTFAQAQETAFRQQIEWSLQYQLPIIIHTRNATQDTISIVKEYANRGVRGIFHCFGGSYQTAQEILELGFYLGIGGVLTYKKAGLSEVLEKISLDHLVLETDAPYLTPVPFRGKRNESSYLQYVAAKLAEVKKVPVEMVAAITTANAQKIFGV